MNALVTSKAQLQADYTALQQQAASANLNLSPADAQQALDLYNATVTDGRYLKDLMTDPAGVANKLSLPLSATAAQQIKTVGSMQAFQPGGTALSAQSPVEVVCVAIIVLILARPVGVAPTQVVVDSSGVVKV